MHKQFYFAAMVASLLFTTTAAVRADDGGVVPPVYNDGPTPVPRDIRTMSGNVTDVLHNGPVTRGSQTYLDFRQQLSSANGAAPATQAASNGPIVIDATHLASHIIGAAAKDSDGNTLGVIIDITINPQGAAQKLILTDSGALGMKDKDVAVDYKALEDMQSTNGSSRTLDKSLLGSVALYDKNGDTGNIQLSNLRGAVLKGPTQKTMGAVEDVVLTNGVADQLVLSFDTVLGIGGDKAVMSFSDASIVNKGNGTYIQLTSHQSDVLAALKSSK